MKKYKLSIILVAFLMCCVILPAQERNDYLQRIDSCTSLNDCRKARIWYNIYKDITNKTDVGIELRIAACEGTSPEPEMVYVQGGTFTMGCTPEQGNDCTGAEKPAHKVTLGDFYIGKYEVTQIQWEKIMGTNPSYFKGEGDNLPVEKVDWEQVQEFIRRLNQKTGKNYRLPTEAE
ncbi:hypothetical protein JCM30204_17030 [Dysgonomonas termitidis]